MKKAHFESFFAKNHYHRLKERKVFNIPLFGLFFDKSRSGVLNRSWLKKETSESIVPKTPYSFY